METTVSAEVFAEALNLILIDRGRGELSFCEQDINRPGLQLAGFFDYFPDERLQVFGRSEMTYFTSLEARRRDAMLEAIVRPCPPGIVVCRGIEAPSSLKRLAARYGVPLFSSAESTSHFVVRVITYLSMLLAQRETRHGVLVEVFGIGMLLTGDSGIGKSETALELIKNGHKLIADDAVEITRVGGDRLVGRAPEVIRYMMEIRGLGLIDVRQMFGVGAVLPSKSIGAVVEMVRTEKTDDSELDRASIVKRYEDILGVKVPLIVIPVAPGRNLASIVEIASRGLRLEWMGYSAAEEIDERLDEMRAQKTDGTLKNGE